MFFFKYEKPYTAIHFLSRKVHYVTIPISEIAEKMPLPLALCNRSTIINLWHIEEIHKEDSKLIIYLNHNHYCIASKVYYREIKEKYSSVKEKYFRCIEGIEWKLANGYKEPNPCVRMGNVQFNTLDLTIIERNRIYSVPYAEIISITTNRPYTEIIWNKGKYIHAEIPVSNIMEYLPYIFFLCSRSAIINLHHVTLFDENNAVCMANGIIFPISRRCKKTLEEKILYLKKSNFRNDSCLSCRKFPNCKTCYKTPI